MAANEKAPGWKLGLAPSIGYPTYDAPIFKESAGSVDPVDQIRFLRDQGFPGIDDTFLKRRPVEQQTRIGEELARTGMRIGSFLGNTESTRLALLGSPDKDARAQLHAELLTSIETSKRTGAKMLLTVSARDLNIPLQFQLANAIDTMRFLADVAEKAGVILCLEHTNPVRMPGMLMESLGDSFLLLKAVNSPAVKLIADFMHFHMTEASIFTALDRVWDHIGAIQMADVPGRTELGSGELNARAIFSYLQKRGYTGLIGLEHSLSTPGLATEKAYLAYLHKLNDEL